ncbi:hypothetical protein C8A05DRAFT_33494 [Staphylotrichum tortipilum]|uniref:Uncharacterized protein n=1 Tax=Staphylotrichum tortipilum TaxID=2831512 RepID=A0AAN6MLG1_9PEZI|nr:hypothetical protein C8A05DRAFT_33494 [Staphylotrichum longicolle]
MFRPLSLAESFPPELRAELQQAEQRRAEQQAKRRSHDGTETAETAQDDGKDDYRRAKNEDDAATDNKASEAYGNYVLGNKSRDESLWRGDEETVRDAFRAARTRVEELRLNQLPFFPQTTARLRAQLSERESKLRAREMDRWEVGMVVGPSGQTEEELISVCPPDPGPEPAAGPLWETGKGEDEWRDEYRRRKASTAPETIDTEPRSSGHVLVDNHGQAFWAPDYSLVPPANDAWLSGGADGFELQANSGWGEYAGVSHHADQPTPLTSLLQEPDFYNANLNGVEAAGTTYGTTANRETWTHDGDEGRMEDGDSSSDSSFTPSDYRIKRGGEARMKDAAQGWPQREPLAQPTFSRRPHHQHEQLSQK